jgi:hypothetical protein
MARKRYEEHREYWRKRKAKEAREPNSPQKREEDRRKYAEEMEARRKREEAAKMEPAPFHNATALIHEDDEFYSLEIKLANDFSVELTFCNDGSPPYVAMRWGADSMGLFDEEGLSLKLFKEFAEVATGNRVPFPCDGCGKSFSQGEVHYAPMLRDDVWLKLADQREVLCVSCMLARARKRGFKLTTANLLPCEANLWGDHGLTET